jgi:hypothetical protein
LDLGELRLGSAISGRSAGAFAGLANATMKTAFNRTGVRFQSAKLRGFD